LRKEQARIAREREARSAAKTGGSADSSEAQGQGGDGDLKSDKSGADGKGTKDAHDGDLKSTKQGGSKTGGANGSGKGPSTAPAEAGGGEDDDIVARQLREAAEKETDPELREKLWKEYVEYKKSVKR
jgi:hypothetical protein